MPEHPVPSRPTPPRSTPPPRPPLPRSPGSSAAGGPTGIRRQPGASRCRAEEQRPRKMDLTVNKVIAGAGAAATSAVLGSFFGAMGTVAGAAVGSVASTMVTSLYEHSLDRTRDTVAARIRRRRRGGRERPRPAPRAAPAAAGASGWRARPTHDADAADPAGRAARRPADARRCRPATGRPPGSAPATRRHGRAATPRPRGSAPATGRPGGSSGGGTSPVPAPRRPWGRWIGATAVVFVLGLLVVTGLELLKGSTLTQGRDRHLGRPGAGAGAGRGRADADHGADPDHRADDHRRRPTTTTERSRPSRQRELDQRRAVAPECHAASAQPARGAGHAPVRVPTADARAGRGAGAD